MMVFESGEAILWRKGGGTVVWIGIGCLCLATTKEWQGEGVARGGRANFQVWHGWEIVGNVYGLILWFLCFLGFFFGCLGICLVDGSLAKKVAKALTPIDVYFFESPNSQKHMQWVER